MYIARGYIPDGKGVHYDDEPMRKYVEIMLDDSLLLYLIKNASPRVPLWTAFQVNTRSGYPPWFLTGQAC